MNSLFWPFKSISSIFIFRKSVLTSKICWQSFHRENLIMTVGFFLLILWEVSVRSVGILHPSFSNMATTFSSKVSASTSLGMPRHSCLEYFAFNQHWRSVLTNWLDRRVLTYFVTDTSTSNLEKDSFNSRISTSTLLFTSSSLFWSDKIIGNRSFLLIFCQDPFV